jgi:hypothetical protein
MKIIVSTDKLNEIAYTVCNVRLKGSPVMQLLFLHQYREFQVSAGIKADGADRDFHGLH